MERYRGTSRGLNNAYVPSFHPVNILSTIDCIASGHLETCHDSAHINDDPLDRRH